MPRPLMMGHDLIRGGRRLHGPRREESSQLKVTHLIDFFVFFLLCVGEVVKQLLGAEEEAWAGGQGLQLLQRYCRAAVPLLSKDNTSRHLH